MCEVNFIGNFFMVKLDIFSAADKVWITELTLIHKHIRSVCNSHAQELILILKSIGQCDDKHILTSQIKTIMPVGLAAILAIMFVSTFKMFVDQGQFSDSDFISGRENVQFHDIQNIIENRCSL
jgi:hypothetical protein